jgi:hypothetical protein
MWYSNWRSTSGAPVNAKKRGCYSKASPGGAGDTGCAA